MGVANLALIQIQGIVVGGLAAVMAALMAALSSAAPFQVRINDSGLWAMCLFCGVKC